MVADLRGMYEFFNTIFIAKIYYIALAATDIIDLYRDLRN